MLEQKVEEYIQFLDIDQKTRQSIHETLIPRLKRRRITNETDIWEMVADWVDKRTEQYEEKYMIRLGQEHKDGKQKEYKNPKTPTPLQIILKKEFLQDPNTINAKQLLQFLQRYLGSEHHEAIELIFAANPKRLKEGLFEQDKTMDLLPQMKAKIDQLKHRIYRKTLLVPKKQVVQVKFDPLNFHYRRGLCDLIVRQAYRLRIKGASAQSTGIILGVNKKTVQNWDLPIFDGIEKSTIYPIISRFTEQRLITALNRKTPLKNAAEYAGTSLGTAKKFAKKLSDQEPPELQESTKAYLLRLQGASPENVQIEMNISQTTYDLWELPHEKSLNSRRHPELTKFTHERLKQGITAGLKFEEIPQYTGTTNEQIAIAWAYEIGKGKKPRSGEYPDIIKKITIKKLKSGESYKNVSDQTNITKQTLRRWLSEEKVTKRSTHHRVITEYEEKLLEEAHEKGMTYKQSARYAKINDRETLLFWQKRGWGEIYIREGYTEKQVQEAHKLLNQGASTRNTSRIIGIQRSAIRNWKLPIQEQPKKSKVYAPITQFAETRLEQAIEKEMTIPEAAQYAGTSEYDTKRYLNKKGLLPKTSLSKYPKEQIQEVHELLRKGATPTNASIITGIPKQAIIRWDLPTEKPRQNSIIYTPITLFAEQRLEQAIEKEMPIPEAAQYAGIAEYHAVRAIKKLEKRIN